MAGKVTDYMKGMMRDQYEGGVAKAQIARNFGISVTTVTKYQKEDGWEAPDLSGPGVAAEAVMMADVPDLPPEPATSAALIEEGYTGISTSRDAPLPEVAVIPAELAARIAELEARNAELEDKVKELRDVVEVELYSDAEGVVRVLGEEFIREMALAKLDLENLKLMQRGRKPIDYEDHPEILRRHMDEKIRELLVERTSHVSPMKKLRVVKMVDPKSGHMVQMPMEEQINNMKGEQSAPMAKARAKGYQLCEPYLCQRLDCWLPAVRDPQTQQMVFNGYCGVEHRADDPYLRGTKVADVTTTAHMGIRQ